MARIIDVNSKKGLVSSVLLCMGELSGNKNSKYDLEQPHDRIMLILEKLKFNYPLKKPSNKIKQVISRGSL